MAATETPSERWELQTFVENAFMRMGAAVDRPGYAVLEVLLPEDVARELGTESYLRLAFDAEVARESAGAEFVTYGSPLLDRLAEWGMRQGTLLRRYVAVANVRIPPDLEQRAQKALSFPGRRRPTLRWSRLALAGYMAFEFAQTLTADEKVEWVETVWIDMQSGSACDGTSRRQVTTALASAFFEPMPEQVLPLSPHVDLKTAYQSAVRAAQRRADEHRARYAQSLRLQKNDETRKVNRYYDGLAESLRRRLERTADPKKADDLKAKLEANEADRRRRLQDVADKFDARVESRLLRLLWYLVPSVRFALETERKGTTCTLELDYNLASHSLVLPLCGACGREIHVVSFNDAHDARCEEHVGWISPE